MIGSRLFSRDTNAIHTRFVRHVKRQFGDATVFNDDHYPTFYGSNFSNSPFIWTGGLAFTHPGASQNKTKTWETLAGSVLLWTRAVPTSVVDGSTPVPDQSVPVCVTYKVFASPITSYDVDFTVKVEATGLNTKYWYIFADCAKSTSTSPVGVTRTISWPDTPASKVNGRKNLSIAVFSCSRYQDASADIFIHLGDYIYESLGNGSRQTVLTYGHRLNAPIGRAVLGREVATIFDYRQRLAQYSNDDVADNAWKAGTADSNDTAAGCSFSPSGAWFTDRKLAAVRAYHEWMPIRQVDVGDKLRIWRNFQIVKLWDLTMLDTRNYDRDLRLVNTISSFPNRSMIGFFDTLSASKKRGAAWRITSGFLTDRYTGHMYVLLLPNAEKQANYASVNTHSYDPVTGKGGLGVEFAGTAVTSTSTFGGGIAPAAADAISRVLVANNTDLQWSEGSYRASFCSTSALYLTYGVSRTGANKLSRSVAGVL
ncbi:PhoD-like phosphatase-domain-containing protein [Lactarius quietus]|nr:PhoD-like phosphatase-domain-containing protein [Lactarius quietus]